MREPVMFRSGDGGIFLFHIHIFLGGVPFRRRSCNLFSFSLSSFRRELWMLMPPFQSPPLFLQDNRKKA